MKEAGSGNRSPSMAKKAKANASKRMDVVITTDYQ